LLIVNDHKPLTKLLVIVHWTSKQLETIHTRVDIKYMVMKL